MIGKRPRVPEDEPPHDILAAEAFAMGEGDRGLHRDPVHDVLAAEEFAVPAPDPRLHARREARTGPPPGSGRGGGDEADAPHDILAADEFALPGAELHNVPPGWHPAVSSRGDTRGRVWLAAVTVVALWRWRRRRRQRPRPI